MRITTAAAGIALTGVLFASGPTTAAVTIVSPTARQPGKSLRIRIAGLPTSVPARVIVTGPRGFRTVISKSRTLRGLGSGRYRVSARPVNTSSGKAKVRRKKRVRTVKVTKSKGRRVFLLYVTPGTA
ncbi:MAG: hypothetical protein R2720_13930 [Candidatus Nanopelagicales bacterium]